MIVRLQQKNVNVRNHVCYVYHMLRHMMLQYHHYHHYLLPLGPLEHKHCPPISREDDYLILLRRNSTLHIQMTMLSTYYYRSQVSILDHQVKDEHVQDTQEPINQP